MPAARAHRLTTFRGFPPFRVPATARDVRALWERRLDGAPSDYPIWMHVHVPFCPQICSFCHCGKELLRRNSDLDAWLVRIRDEATYFADALRGTRIQYQYFGGGTPNLLSPAQLDDLLDLLEERFDHSTVERRTLEILPSAYRDGTLEVAARHGIRRLSCGVQSTDMRALHEVGRQPDFEMLAHIMERAQALGVNDVNIDLAWGMPGDTEEGLFRSLSAVLALEPTSVSIHLLIPTPKYSAFRSESEAREIYARFRALPEFPHDRSDSATLGRFLWYKLPTVVAVVGKDYVARGEYRTFQYSDMETVGMDMLGLGRYALSHLLGRARYENMTAVDRFDASEPGYRLAYVDGIVDGALDALADLLRDGTCDFASIERRYAPEGLEAVRSLLESLSAEGYLVRAGATYAGPGITSDLFGPAGDFVDLALSRAVMLNPGAAVADRPQGPTAASFELEFAGTSVAIRLEKARPSQTYFATVGAFGISHERLEGPSPPGLVPTMERLTALLGEVVSERPRTLPELASELQRRLPGSR
jgi:coproporphyrinogen III oxidase-like Fe-S oxidoreductase